MTDKQIIIDGVDVSGCSCIENGYCLWVKKYYETGSTPKCEQVKDCYYKQLKRKEQECEELRGDLYFTNEQLKDFKSHYDKVVEECENLREKYLGLKEQKGSYIVQLNTVNEQLDQLKAENDKYSLFIEKLCDYAGLECDDEEQAMRTLSDLASQMNKARWIIDRYKQTLTEIKDIAEKRNYLDYNECLDDILQKISECEGNNG